MVICTVAVVVLLVNIIVHMSKTAALNGLWSYLIVADKTLDKFGGLAVSKHCQCFIQGLGYLNNGASLVPRLSGGGGRAWYWLFAHVSYYLSVMMFIVRSMAKHYVLMRTLCIKYLGITLGHGCPGVVDRRKWCFQICPFLERDLGYEPIVCSTSHRWST